MRSEFMVMNRMEYFLPIPVESFPIGGRPTLEVRFSVHLYVAKISGVQLAFGLFASEVLGA